MFADELRRAERESRRRLVKDRTLRRLYGITLEQYERMLTAQDGVCAICHMPETTKFGQHLAVDHDHATGKIRALLCMRCNTTLGVLRDNPELAERLLEYLELHRER